MSPGHDPMEDESGLRGTPSAIKRIWTGYESMEELQARSDRLGSSRLDLIDLGGYDPMEERTMEKMVFPTKRRGA